MGSGRLRLRLQPGGSTRGRTMRVLKLVVSQAHWRRDTGKVLEVLGHFIPEPLGAEHKASNTKRVMLNVDRIKYWLAMGVTCTNQVNHVLGFAGILPMHPERGANVYRPFFQNIPASRFIPSSGSGSTAPAGH
ncbi:30S ribosomal protein S16-1, chloroplastic [Porphyridium purpureum]|uniref:30S ribosomal protein S16-1, chloroplastic n=1 Tax=Porphyridium purpureum TaxID=35688 RepID=A0A5J4YMP8_PORPP|nr:30S ribosomal protein S16-1, chloroplastic [Porphyridium purpureum]|eukprot:POR0152..scf295_9